MGMALAITKWCASSKPVARIGGGRHRAGALAVLPLGAQRSKGAHFMRKLIVVTMIGGVLAWASIAGADPNLSDVTSHRHYIQTEDGKTVQVGPRVCDDPALQHAFNEFHANTHTHNGVTGEIGPVAPGLHN